MVQIYKRYQYWSREGIAWTKWFVFNKVETKKEAQDYIKKLPVKVNKLLNEYKIE